MKTLKDFDFKNKKVLIRCDFNVPQDEQGNISEDFKIREALPTLKYLLDKGAILIIMSHLGDPDACLPAGKVKCLENLKLDKVTQKLSELLNLNIKKVNDCIGKEVEFEKENLKSGEILILENIRFYKQEIENDENFARQLSLLCDIYVNEAFAVDHRSHASLVGVPKILPSCAGFLLEKEINALDKILQAPEKPMTAIVGGKKVETKAKFINKISEVADFVIVSGLIKKEIKEKNIQLKFPDKIIGPEEDLSSLDINDRSIKIFKEKIMQSKTILWNGPFGKFEDQNYKKGTLAIANAIVESGAFCVVGGGETVEFVRKENLFDKFSHVCTGGGAMLSYLSGEKLPGIEALK